MDELFEASGTPQTNWNKQSVNPRVLERVSAVPWFSQELPRLGAELNPGANRTAYLLPTLNIIGLNGNATRALVATANYFVDVARRGSGLEGVKSHSSLMRVYESDGTEAVDGVSTHPDLYAVSADLAEQGANLMTGSDTKVGYIRATASPDGRIAYQMGYLDRSDNTDNVLPL